MNNVTKKDLANAIADQVGISPAKAMEVLETTIDIVIRGAQGGKAVYVPHLGCFGTTYKHARVGRVLSKKDLPDITIPARTKLQFKPSENLKESILTNFAELK